MKLELKNLKFSPELSKETPAFAAIIVIDGQERGTVRNSGTGGANLYTDRTARTEIDAWAKTLPHVNFNGITFPESDETVIFGMVYDSEEVAA